MRHALMGRKVSRARELFLCEAGGLIKQEDVDDGPSSVLVERGVLLRKLFHEPADKFQVSD
jgi:hypothetical protein